MRWPSGDQCGTPVACAPSEVSWTQLDPSLSQAQISRAPERSDSNAIFLPSGEYWGANSVRVDGINLVGILAASVLPALLLQSGMATRQMFKGPPELATYAKRRPCLEIAGKEPPLPIDSIGWGPLGVPNRGTAIFHNLPR